MRDAINAALKHAMKGGDKARAGTLRLINAAIKDRDIAMRGEGKEAAGEAEIIEVLAKMVKQREESRKIYAEAGRDELAAQEAAEIAVISEFLPKQLSEEEMTRAIDEAIAKTGASTIKDMGKVMGALKGAYAGQMDFGKAGAAVKARLG
jgi:hypothetical protein